jgi:hypothetical protein
MNNTIAAPYTKADITEEVVIWAMGNPNYTVPGAPVTPPVTPPYVPPVTPGTGKPGATPVIVYSAATGCVLQLASCVLQLASFPGGADYWIDGYPPGTKSGVTKDYSKYEWDYIQLPCGEHSIFVRIPGYEDIEEIITVGTGLTMFIAAPDMISATGTPSGKVGTLAVTAKAADTGETIPWGLVRLRSEKAKTGGVYVGVTPYSGKVEVAKYNVVVSAKGYEDAVKKVTINMNQRTSVAFSLQPVTLAAVLKIVAGGPAYIAGMSFKDYDALFVGNTRKDWVRVETTILDVFRVKMIWYHHREGEPVSNLTQATELFGPLHGVLTTEKKMLSPHMTGTERHLDFAEYIVPNYPGLYRVVFTLEREK